MRVFNTSTEDNLTAATTQSQDIGPCEYDLTGAIEHTNTAYADPHVTHISQ